MSVCKGAEWYERLWHGQSLAPAFSSIKFSDPAQFELINTQKRSFNRTLFYISLLL